jgi:amino acid adenylation domain-containing protein
LDGKRDIKDLLGQVRTTTLEAYDHMDAPFEKIVEFLVQTRDMSRSPLFQVLFVLHDDRAVPSIDLPAVQLSPETVPNATAKFELTFDVSGSEDQLRVRIEYSTDLWTRDSIIRMAGHYKELLRSMVSRPAEPIALLNMLTSEERAALLSPVEDGGTSDEGTSDGPGKTLVQLWEEQVAATPDRIALVGGHEEWSYGMLNKRANQLANYLRSRYQIKPNDLVAILLDRGQEMIISILAVLKAGAAYMPIDPEYPADRIGFMVSDSGCRLLLDKAGLWAFNKEQKQYSEEDLIRTNKPGDLAYVIYTSGTTGRPKGVLIEHRNIVGLVRNKKFRGDFSADDVWTLFHSFCFDVSVWEMYGAFLYGGKLVLVTRETARDPESLARLLQKERVTILSQTPSAFYNLIETVEKKAVNGLTVRYVILAGEALSPGRLRSWRSRYPGTRLINMYGITETTVHSTYKEIGEREIAADQSYIGAPLPGIACYVMDPSGGLSPVGIPGELYVGGSGVARGYLNREELTRERFIPHPFREGERLYRSGDRVRWLDKGEMEYLGRLDEQLKIRGYRIEPGEIDSALRSFPGISAVVTVARPGRMGEKELVAYIVRRGGATAADGSVAANRPGTVNRPGPSRVAEMKPLNTVDINNFLKSRLPEYMVPAHYVLLDQLPLTTNGKIDKKNLPDPEGLSLPIGEKYEAPGNGTEDQLVLIWQEVLGKDRIGVNDNFFDAGGNSIKLIRMVGMVNKAFDVNISVVSAFKLPNIRQLAEQLRSRTANGEEGSIEDIKRSADIMQGTLNVLKNKVYGK